MTSISNDNIETLLSKIRSLYKHHNRSSEPMDDEELPVVPVTPLEETLSFRIGGSILPYLGQGWGAPEGDIIWSTAAECYLILRLAPAKGDLIVRFTGEYLRTKELPITPIELWLNNRIIGSWDEHHQGELSTLVFQDQIPASRILRLVFKFKSPRSPKELGISDDVRLLGYAFKSMQIKEII